MCGFFRRLSRWKELQLIRRICRRRLISSRRWLWWSLRLWSVQRLEYRIKLSALIILDFYKFCNFCLLIVSHLTIFLFYVLFYFIFILASKTKEQSELLPRRLVIFVELMLNILSTIIKTTIICNNKNNNFIKFKWSNSFLFNLKNKVYCLGYSKGIEG